MHRSSSLLEANQQQHQDQRALHGNDRDKLLKYAPADNKLKKINQPSFIIIFVLSYYHTAYRVRAHVHYYTIRHVQYTSYFQYDTTIQHRGAPWWERTWNDCRCASIQLLDNFASLEDSEPLHRNPPEWAKSPLSDLILILGQCPVLYSPFLSSSR